MSAAPSFAAEPVRLPAIDGLIVRRPLGRGGMGAVFLAFEATTRRRVALKVIAGDPPGPDARRRFATEIAAASSVVHPNVVRLRGAGEAGGTPFAVFDYVPGFGLDRVAGPLPTAVATHLAWQLASAVDAVHSAGYLHRDLKPANVMVTRSGWLTLIDLGLAKAFGDAEVDVRELPPGEAIDELTAPGTCVGTPRYLAPEVAAGAPASVRSDLFALGLVITRLLGGAAANDRDDVPAVLADLIVRCLAPDPAARPTSARELVETLASLHRHAGPVREGLELDGGGGRDSYPANGGDLSTVHLSAQRTLDDVAAGAVTRGLRAPRAA